jgi:nucleoside-diphosphate-sugar epimerase
VTLKVLVTGASGFVGRALVPHLVDRGHEVEGWSRSGTAVDARARFRRVDLVAPGSLLPPDGAPWDAAFHLAAHAAPGAPWTRGLVLENVAMTARVVDHLSAHAPGCRTIVVSSGRVYASGPGRRKESDPVEPAGSYALSKALSEAWALSKKAELDVQVVRPFNQIGPGMAAGLLLPDLLERARAGDDPIRMRGRDDGKDFLDVRDAVDAYEALLTVDAPSGSIWNLCSGIEVSVSTLIREVLSALSIRRDVVFEDASVEVSIGDPGKLEAACGFRPRRSLRETAEAIARAAKRLTFVVAALALASIAAADDPGEAKAPIQDNSFLIEEAYNQDAGVIQHIQIWNRPIGAHAAPWSYSFTEEWPAGGQRHQVSVTVPYGEKETGGSGLGDVALHYRLQAIGLGGGPLALAPRISVLFATGDERAGTGAGGPGLQLGLPVSVEIGESFVMHGNLGSTWTPSARGGGGAEASTLSWSAGASGVWLAGRRWNLLLETVYEREETVLGERRTERSSGLVVNPGIRFAFDRPSGLQIVPGIAIPIGVGPSEGERAVLLYLSFEHPVRGL